MIASTRFRLVMAGLALAAMALIAVTLAPADRIDPILRILPWAEGLIGMAIWSDTHRKIGTARGAPRESSDN